MAGQDEQTVVRGRDLLKAELLASVSHELRSPLATIKGYAATLLRHEQRISRKERREFLVAISESSDRLANVIDHLLELSELEAGTISIEQNEVHLLHLLREAITGIEQRADCSEEAGKMGAALSPVRNRCLFTIPLEDANGNSASNAFIIRADRYRLREVLDNLLENAMVHSPLGGSIEVTIRPIMISEAIKELHVPSQDIEMKLMAALQRHHQMVMISVHDNGVGIPREHLERIFERFYRVDVRLTRQTNGLGLGLTVCKRIVELHDGVIWAESEVGLGSTFSICLPINGTEAHGVPGISYNV